MSKSITFTVGPTPGTVRAPDGNILNVPKHWLLLMPGDPGLTRRVKLAGEHFAVTEKKGRKVFSRGVWAPAETIARIQAALEAERSTESYGKRKAADALRREKAQGAYAEDFCGAVRTFLDFDAKYHDVAEKLARAVTAHATPVGSGTVARTQRIPIEERAEAAVIAWMRHQTTGYDNMMIRQFHQDRREIRQRLAQRSHELLDKYRRGDVVSEQCPLRIAIARGNVTA